MSLMSLLIWYIMLQVQGQLILDNSLSKCQMLKISSRWAPAAVSPRIFPKKMESFHGHSWVLVHSSGGALICQRGFILLCILLEGIWASPTLLCCLPSFSSYNEHKITYFLLSWGIKSEARKHADLLRDKFVWLHMLWWLILLAF